MRLLERAIRRSELPVKMSEGFNPKPRFSYLLALGIGIESEAEVVTLRLAEWTRTREVRERLERQLPDGIEIRDVSVAPPKAKPIASTVTYTVEADDEDAVGAEQIERLLGSDSVPVERLRKGKYKTVNIRPFIRTIRRDGNRLTMEFHVTTAGTANPIEALTKLGIDEEVARTRMRIVRTGLM